MINGTWTLHSDGRQIADLVVTDADFPWLYARVERRPGFEDVEDLFRQELQAVAAIDDDVEAWEAVHQRVVDTVELRHQDGTVPAEFILHIDGDQAWWRWSDDLLDDD